MAVETSPDKRQEKLPTEAHLMCGWPLALVVIGGAIGGALGGAAYAVNVAIYKSRLPVPGKIVLNVLTGASAFIVWAAIVGVLREALS